MEQSKKNGGGNKLLKQTHDSLSVEEELSSVSGDCHDHHTTIKNLEK
jgi:hypothetical protein